MKNIKAVNHFKIAALALLMSACSLDIKETDSLITQGESAVFNGLGNEEAVNAAITTLYNNISGQMDTQENLYALTEVSSDVLIVPTRGTDWGDNGVWRTLDTHTWGTTHKFILGTWNDRNSAVLLASQVIDPKSNPTTLQAAQAKFIRAYNMWIVMDLFGKVPFRDPSDGPNVTPSVKTRAEAYDFIVKDLTDAIAGLPSANTDKTKAVKASARLLLAKVKLNTSVYKGAYGTTDLQDVIDLVNAIEADGYAVSNGYFETFVGPSFANTDVMWTVPSGIGSKVWSALHYNQGYSTTIEGQSNTGGGWNGFSTYSEFYDKFSSGSNAVTSNTIGGGQEERKGYTQSLATTNATNQGFGYGFQVGPMFGWKDGKAVALLSRAGGPLSFTKDFPGLTGNNDITGIRPLKYSPADGGAFHSGQVVFRFADAHLMRAEAMMRSGNAAGALIEVNKLRAKRTNTPALATLDEATLLDERGRELYMECWRRNDMIRFGKFAKGKWQFKDEGDGHTDLYPIPASAILTNPNLIQNPGY